MSVLGVASLSTHRARAEGTESTEKLVRLQCHGRFDKRSREKFYVCVVCVCVTLCLFLT